MTGVRSDEVSNGLGEIARDTLAMEAFVALHRERLLRLAGLVCGDVASTEDIVQMALERAWRSRRAISADERLRPWLDRIVVREQPRGHCVRGRRPDGNNYRCSRRGIAISLACLAASTSGRRSATRQGRLLLLSMSTPRVIGPCTPAQR
jgi:hypothetical protein